MDALVAGDEVRAPLDNGVADVVLVLKTQCDPADPPHITYLNKLPITAYHPVHHNGRWTHPTTIHPAVPEPARETVYSFLLSNGHTLLINDVTCITLGHGFDADVARHPYFGTKRVTRDLSRLPADANGVIHAHASWINRNALTTLVTGITMNC